MRFQEMDPEVALRLIANEPNVITEAARVDQQLYEHIVCPVCGNQGADKVVRSPKIGRSGVIEKGSFAPDQVLALGDAQCRTCNSVFEIHSRVIASVGEPVITAVQAEDPPQR